MTHNLKTVNLKPETKERLLSLGSKGETFNDIVERLLNKALIVSGEVDADKTTTTTTEQEERLEAEA